MNKLAGFIAYLVKFLAVDILVFFGVYFFHTLQVKGFPLSAAIVKGCYEVLWRLVTLQLLVQTLLMAVLFYFVLHRNLALILIAGFIAFSIAAVISTYQLPSILKLLYPFNSEGVGEGFAILFSVLCAWASLELIKRP